MVCLPIVANANNTARVEFLFTMDLVLSEMNSNAIMWPLFCLVFAWYAVGTVEWYQDAFGFGRLNYRRDWKMGKWLEEVIDVRWILIQSNTSDRREYIRRWQVKEYPDMTTERLEATVRKSERVYWKMAAENKSDPPITKKYTEWLVRRFAWEQIVTFEHEWKPRWDGALKQRILEQDRKARVKLHPDCRLRLDALRIVVEKGWPTCEK
ncbi:hypothetical protein Vi05172_g12361 [Venturia inaequalis]|nr:hypothetical protein Vi05172_g12361 [Venturia inaequalis]